MNKKIIIVILILIIAIIAAMILNKDDSIPEPVQPDNPLATESPDDKVVTVTKDMEDKIIEDSFLNILVQIQTFDSLNVDYEPLLEAAMRIAEALNLYETSEDGMYLQYVPKDVIHEIIYELSGIRIQEPINIEDFYYLYDKEKDYYYVVPIGASWMYIKEIESVSYSKSDIYIIRCSSEVGTEDYDIKTSYPNMELRLKYKPTNKYVKYQLVSINPGLSNIEIP